MKKFFLYILRLPLLFATFYGFLRRWFGGGFKSTRLGNNRGVQCVVMVLSTMIVSLPYFYGFTQWWVWLIWLVANIWLYAQFWSRGHGPEFDEGRGSDPRKDPELMERYNKRWFHKLLNKIFAEPHRYGFWYDFWSMLLRYTGPMIPMYFISPIFLKVGLLVSPIYAICWTLSEKDPWIFQKPLLVKMRATYATALAEWVVGFVFGYAVVVGTYDAYERLSTLM